MKRISIICLLLSLFIFSCTDDITDNEVVNLVPTVLPKYPVRTIEVKSENNERFTSLMAENSFSTRAGYLIKDSIWPGGSGHSMIYETNEFTLTQDIWRYIYIWEVF